MKSREEKKKESCGRGVSPTKGKEKKFPQGTYPFGGVLNLFRRIIKGETEGEK